MGRRTKLLRDGSPESGDDHFGNSPQAVALKIAALSVSSREMYPTTGQIAGAVSGNCETELEDERISSVKR